MIFISNKYNRRSIRIKEYDYSKEGMYFITICTQDRKKILSQIDIVNEDKINNCRGRSCACPEIKMYLFGKIVEEQILNINDMYSNIMVDKYVIMPNHIHMIIDIRAGTRPAPTLNDIIRDFKSITTLKYIKHIKKKFDKRIWQRNYYEHIIRNEKEYWQICEYIENNPLKWKFDQYY